LIVLIARAHQAKLDDASIFCPDAQSAPDGPRHKTRRPLACMGAKSILQAEEIKDVFNLRLKTR